MTIEQLSRDDETIVRRYEYEDDTVLVVDFGASDADATVDVVDDTVMVVIGDDQYDFDLPADGNDAHTFMKNGVLTIELETDL